MAVRVAARAHWLRELVQACRGVKAADGEESLCSVRYRPLTVASLWFRRVVKIQTVGIVPWTFVLASRIRSLPEVSLVHGA